MSWLRKAFSKPKPTTVILSSPPPVSFKATETLTYVPRKETQVPKEKLESLFHGDPLTFQIVQKFSNEICGKGYDLYPPGEITDRIREWCDKVDLGYIATEIVKDCFVTGAGNAWVELVYNSKGNDITMLRMINPKSGIDYIRNNRREILYDDDLRPLGFKLGGIAGFPEMEWRRDEIKVRGETIWKPRPGEDGRDHIAHFKLVGLGEYELGMSPLAPAYKVGLIRLNLEDTIGNAGFRAGSIVARVGSPEEPPMSVTDEQLKTVFEELQNVDSHSIWTFRRNVDIETFPIPDIGRLGELLKYFADLYCSGVGIKLPLLLQPDRGYAGDIEVAEEEFLETVSGYQKTLETQIRNKLFKRALKAWGIDQDKAPYIQFRKRQGRVALSAARRIATYARRGLMRYDPWLERHIRVIEGLPTEPVDRLIEEWKKLGKVPEELPER